MTDQQVTRPPSSKTPLKAFSRKQRSYQHHPLKAYRTDKSPLTSGIDHTPRSSHSIKHHSCHNSWISAKTGRPDFSPGHDIIQVKFNRREIRHWQAAE